MDGGIAFADGVPVVTGKKTDPFGKLAEAVAAGTGTPATLGKRSTMLQLKASPADRVRNADTKMGRCRWATRTPINRSNDTVPKVL